ncbi:MAG: hypothetical protein FWD15_03450 [Alphaproteobacteria bacterium]|nr:hypothetical protein [Alphaproteobacteria bacterium]
MLVPFGILFIIQVSRVGAISAWLDRWNWIGLVARYALPVYILQSLAFKIVGQKSVVAIPLAWIIGAAYWHGERWLRRRLA